MSKQLDDRSTQIGQQIGSVAQELRSVGDQLKSSPVAGPVAGYVDTGVGYVERLGQYLQDADGDQLIHDLETYARRQPWAFAAGAMALGFAASRFLKTSSSRRYHATGGSAGTAGSTGGATAGYGNTGLTGYGSTGYGSSSYGAPATAVSTDRNLGYDSGLSGTTGGSTTRTTHAGGTGATGATGSGSTYDEFDAATDTTGIRSGGERYAT